MQITKQHIKDYKNYLYEEEKSQATIEKYIRDIYKFYESLEEGIISKEALISYKQKLIIKYQLASINSMLISIHGFLDYIELSEYKVKLLKIQKKTFIDQEVKLTKEEYHRLLSAAQSNERLFMLIQTICSTGIRVSEHRFITVEALKNKKAIVSNKGKIRYIFFPKQLRKQLLCYCKKNRIKKGPVFITRSGKPMDRSNIWLSMKALCQQARVSAKKVYPHNLRHLFALTFYKVEKDLVRLADILGHASIETTRIYTMTSTFECESQISKLNLVRWLYQIKTT